MTKMIFTSCMRADIFRDQPQWTEAAKFEPDYLFLLGDNIYMDYFPYCKSKHPKYFTDKQFKDVMQKKYERQWQEKHFLNLVSQVRQKGGIYGTWDDHDFAWDNAYGEDVSEAKKEISRRMFNTFFYEQESNDKLYKTVDTELARIIILDQRSYSTKPSKLGKLIGDKQLQFFEKALVHDKIYTIVCGSLPMQNSSSIFGLSAARFTDQWAKYQAEYQQVYELLENKNNVVYIGGDIHRNTFEQPNNNQKRPCYEITASGMAIDQWASQWIKRFKNPQNWFDARKNWVTADLSNIGIKLVLSEQTAQKPRKEKEVFIPRI